MTALGDGIRCPACGGETGVNETRNNVGSIRRRRYCAAGCGGRMTTVEIEAPPFSKRLPGGVGDLTVVPKSSVTGLELVPSDLMLALRRWSPPTS